MNKTTIPYKSRVSVKCNTGSKVLRSKKDRAMSREGLKRQLRKELNCLFDCPEYQQFTSIFIKD